MIALSVLLDVSANSFSTMKLKQRYHLIAVYSTALQ